VFLCLSCGLPLTHICCLAPVGSGTNPICPAPPPGYAPYPAAQIKKDQEYGEALSNRYALSGLANKKRKLPTRLNNGDDVVATVSSLGFPSPAKRDTCSTAWPQKRGLLNLNASEAALAKRSNRTTNNLVRRALPYRVDLRDEFKFKVKDQTPTQTCATHSFTSMMEGSVLKQLRKSGSKPTLKELSVTWIARCRAGIYDNDGSDWTRLYSRTRDSFQATDSCMPFSQFYAMRDEDCKVCRLSVVASLRALNQVSR
jgi:C1A family cysteine protease